MGVHMSEIKEERFNNDEWKKYLEKAEIANVGDSTFSGYGMTYAIITDKDIKALQEGKVILYDVEEEYRIAIKLGGSDDGQ